MDFTLLIEKIEKHFEGGLPFVVYSLPQEGKVSALLQKNKEFIRIAEMAQNGFVLAPFAYNGDALFIQEAISDKIECVPMPAELELHKVHIAKSTTEGKKYIEKVARAIEKIKSSNAQKIVLSRYREFSLKDFNLKQLLERLFLAYPSAFRYVWYHPQTGMWCGATPETLVQVENNSFKTMALAGTQPYSGTLRVSWGAKELDEQQQVTDSITNSLRGVSSVLKISNTRTHRAGPLLHLRTDITGILKRGKATLTNIATALHPTPAVCGAPQNIAKDFILKNEDYDREFYTGFLGPVTDNGASASLMVNLRCMKIENKTARIFVGGGITIGSQPAEEWQETQNKMQTMLQVLRPML